MSKLMIAEVSIEGLRPLLFHVFGPEALPLEKQERTGVPGNDPEEWRQTHTATKQGQLYLRSDYAFSCLINGARYEKLKRGSLMPLMQSTLQVLDDILLLDRWMPAEPLPTDPDSPVYLDIRSVRNPSTKGRNVRYRVACSPGWHLSFHASFDSTIVSREAFTASLLNAGQLVGIGDGRTIGMGRFEVIDCQFSNGA